MANFYFDDRLCEVLAECEVVADKETGVMYSVSVGGYNSGDFTLLVDENGNPLILESMRE